MVTGAVNPQNVRIQNVGKFKNLHWDLFVDPNLRGGDLKAVTFDSTPTLDVNSPKDEAMKLDVEASNCRLCTSILTRLSSFNTPPRLGPEQRVAHSSLYENVNLCCTTRLILASDLSSTVTLFLVCAP